MNKCIHCEGTGKAACKTCNGEGKVTCSRCGGSGREMSICPTCTKGKVADPRSFDDEPTLVCPDCHGEWQKDVGPCKACNGTGKKSCEFCKGSGKEICELCEGTGSVDIESMCKSVIDVAEEIGEYDSNRWNVCINKITSDMAAAIFDAANRGVGIAAYVASTLCADYEELAGGEDAYDKYHTTAIASNNKIALYMYWVGGIIECGGMEEDIITDIKKSAEQGYVPALALLAGHYYDCGDDGEVCTADWSKALECWKKILEVKDDDEWNLKTIKIAELHVKYLPSIISGDAHAMLELGASVLEAENEWERQPKGPETVLSVNAIGRHWLERAEGSNDIKVLRDVAKYYWENDDKNKANVLYEKMADSGDVASLSLLGDNLRCGDGVGKDARKAFVYLYQAAEKGDIVALRHLAHLYRDGEYAEKSRSKANELYVRAAKAGDGWSLYEIGKCYLNGTEVNKDETEAKRLLKLAADKGVTQAEKALASISDSVKDKNKGPSGIVVGKLDGGSLPKFAKVDYNNAVAGKPSEKSSAKKIKSTSASSKKRWKFVVLGLLFGFFGLHLAYAKRWLLLLLLWAGFITGNVMSGGKSESEKTTKETTTQVVATNDADKNGGGLISGIGFGVWALLWIGGTLFIKKDGKGNRM